MFIYVCIQSEDDNVYRRVSHVVKVTMYASFSYILVCIHMCVENEREIEREQNRERKNNKCEDYNVYKTLSFVYKMKIATRMKHARTYIYTYVIYRDIGIEDYKVFETLSYTYMYIYVYI